MALIRDCPERARLEAAPFSKHDAILIFSAAGFNLL
jgi:hypothetical protein